jgi:signal transduction histidine kinase
MLTSEITTLIPLFASVAAAAIGALILWSNSARSVNRAVFSCSFHLFAWLLCLYLAMTLQPGLPWLRWTCAVGASVPIHFWFVKESIAGGAPGWIRAGFRRYWGWVLISAALSILPFTDAFIPSHSTSATRLLGWGYSVYIGVNLTLYIVLLIDTFRAMRQLSGARRLEMQVWLYGGCAMTTVIFTFMALNALTHERIFILLQPLVVLVFYSSAVGAITTHRIFEARQIILVFVEKSLLVSLTAGAGYLLLAFTRLVLPEPVAVVVTTAVALWFAFALTRWLDQRFQFYPQAHDARQAALSAAQRHSRVESLEKSFSAVLKGWGQSDHAVIISGDKNHLTAEGIELPCEGTVVRALRQLRWATPERLARERSTPDRLALDEFMAGHDLGVVVIEEGVALTAVLGVGIAASRRPFTYPQVTQLAELASIMESALERAHFSAKVQHAEQLATVGLLGASLAHEIRNPLVTIKTFVQLLPQHHQDAAFREKFFRLIGEEVGRIDQLTEQLLDLASPRTYTAQWVELHPVLNASLALVAAKAADKRIEFLTEFQAVPDRAFTDPSAAKQVMLNLCFNAIQAVDTDSRDERWVKIATRNTSAGVEMAIADSGPGISADIRPRLFQPFQTTKSTGFGLGLAICSDILANLNASITVDPPAAGRGATFRVTFPCQPLSS